MGMVVAGTPRRGKPLPPALAKKMAQRRVEGTAALEDDFWGPVIFQYTRAQALKDGELVLADPELCREAGITFPLALSRGAWAEAVATTRSQEQVGQSVTGRLWDVLMVMRAAIRQAKAGSDEAHFRVSVYGPPRRNVALWVRFHPGDQGEPVLTVMLEGED